MIDKYIKNIDSVSHTYAGQTILAGAYYKIEAIKELLFRADSELLTDIASGKAQMARSGDGNNDITDVAEQLLFLVGDSVTIEKGSVTVDKGVLPFDTKISHNFCDNTTWSSGSTFVFKPATGKFMEIPKAEVQFTHDVKLATQTSPGEMYFDVWVGNPLFNPGASVDADDPAWHPTQGPTINPMQFLYDRKIFKSLKDVFDLGNDHYSMEATVDGIPGVTTVRFDYDQLQILKSSELAEIRVSLKNDAPMEGTFCTISLVEREFDE